MAEDDDISSQGGPLGATPPGDALAAALAADLSKSDPAMAARVGRLLDELTRLLRLQTAELEREDSIRHWSLRLRHVSDVLKLAFEVSFAFIVLVVAIGLGATIWSAARDKDLVIEPFSVPPDFAARGLTGDVLAADIVDRATLLANKASLTAGLAPDVFRPDSANDIKVQIPDTGVSIGQLYAYLVRWLGHQRRISGAIYRDGENLVLTLRIEGADSRQFVGNVSNFDRIEREAAEHLFAQTQPTLYTALLAQQGRFKDALAFIPPFATKGSANERASTLLSWAFLLQFTDLRTATEKAREAGKVLPSAVDVLFGTEAVLGQDEASLEDAQKAFHLRDTIFTTLLARAALEASINEWLAEERGDFAAASSVALEWSRLPYYFSGASFLPNVEAQDLAAAHDIARSRWVLRQAHASDDASVAASEGGVLATVPPLAFVYAAIERGDWSEADRQMQATYDAASRPTSPVHAYMATFFVPWRALTLAMTGRVREAESLIRNTPGDCYRCLIVRAKIAAQKSDWGATAYWFADATKLAPSIPFAYTDWGNMRLRRGDYDGAIAKFEVANQKGPHFADPLEFWGEALIAQNRSDLALAKFEEANKFAPNWGRMHLKWGEALLWTGDKAGAQKQFAIANGLDLSAADRATLARFGAPHG